MAGCEVINWSRDLVISHTNPWAKLKQKVSLWQAPSHVRAACSCVRRKGGDVVVIDLF